MSVKLRSHNEFLLAIIHTSNAAYASSLSDQMNRLFSAIKTHSLVRIKAR
jgi:mevalonate pyrophosphate decarboxylase